MSTCRKMKIDSYLLPCTKLKLKWIKDLHIYLTTLIEEEVESSLQCMGTGDHFLNKTPVAQTLIRAKINKWHLLKPRSSVKQRMQSIGQKDSRLNGKDLHQNHTRQWTDLQSIYRSQEIRHQNSK